MKFKILIKDYTENNTITWRERYEKLLEHHEEETKVLIQEIERLEELQSQEFFGYQDPYDY